MNIAGFSITELLSFGVGIAGGASGVLATLTRVRKEEVESLRVTMAALTQENERLRIRQKELEAALNEANDRAERLEIQVHKMTQKLVQLDCRLAYFTAENEDYRAMLKKAGHSDEEILNGGRTGNAPC